MSRIVWDKPEDRKFEVGVEKGVLYVENGRGVPWNGLISVSESYSGGEVESRYQDGIRTHSYAPTLEFESEIVAYTYPDEFDACLGVSEFSDGISIDEQVRKPFGLTYQTRVGDSVMGDQRGFKIHLIYNAYATPQTTTRTTIGEEYELSSFTWGVKTSPTEAPGFRNSSHFILEPHKIGPRLYKHLEGLLYGTTGTNPRLLSPREIIEIAGDWHILYPSPNTYPSLETPPGGP